MRRTFTADEMHALLYAAYVHGRHDGDIAEMRGRWEANPTPRQTYEQRVARRMEEMDRWAREQARREGRPYRIHPGGPVDYETGEPLREAAA